MPVEREDATIIVKALENFFKTALDGRGRMYIPKEVRDRFSIKGGDKIYIKIESNCLVLYTAKMMEKELRRNPSMVTA